MKLIFALLFSANLASGFMFQKPMSVKDGLVKITEEQTPTPLNIQLNVGQDDLSRLNVKGLIVELSSKLADFDHPRMPGFNGPHPQLSSGVRTLNILQEGSFVNMKGQQLVQTLNGCWEVIWRKNAAAGSLVVGVEVPEEYQRNDASLPKGRLYWSFPVWTRVGLKEAQERRQQVMDRVDELNAAKNKAFEKMEATSNFIMKALHYREAAQAMEETSMQPVNTYESVPTDEEVIELQDDLLLTTKGLVFTKEGAFTSDKLERKLLLGTAVAAATL